MSCEQTTRFEERLFELISEVVYEKNNLVKIQDYFSSMGYRINNDGVEEELAYKICEDLKEYYQGWEDSTGCVNIRKALSEMYGIVF